MFHLFRLTFYMESESHACIILNLLYAQRAGYVRHQTMHMESVQIANGSGSLPQSR